MGRLVENNNNSPSSMNTYIHMGIATTRLARPEWATLYIQIADGLGIYNQKCRTVEGIDDALRGIQRALELGRRACTPALRDKCFQWDGTRHVTLMEDLLLSEEEVRRPTLPRRPPAPPPAPPPEWNPG